MLQKRKKFDKVPTDFLGSKWGKGVSDVDAFDVVFLAIFNIFF
jgi:hypothetical protein